MFPLHYFKQRLKKLIVESPLLQRSVNRFDGFSPKIFLYHRFTSGEKFHPDRINAKVFRWQLEYLAANYNVISFEECLRFHIRHGRWPDKCAVITVDDGCGDFYHYAFPELKRKGLKATFFVTVNYVDRKIWLWPDRLRYAIDQTGKRNLRVSIDGCTMAFPLGDRILNGTAWQRLNHYCIISPEDTKRRLLSLIEEQLEVVVPEKPTPDNAAVNWNELAAMHADGIEIGSHTMNHPILSRIRPGQLRDEIVTSKRVLEDKLNASVHTFCYPNGQIGDINEAVISEVRAAGYLGSPFGSNLTCLDPYKMPRMGVTNDRVDFMAKAVGIEHLGYCLRKFIKGRRL